MRSLRQGGGFAIGNHTFGPRSLLGNIPLDAMRKKEVAMLNEFFKKNIKNKKIKILK